MKIAELHCIKDILIYGRHEDGTPDHCFTAGEDYLFCLDDESDSYFGLNDIGMMHLVRMNDGFTSLHFTINELNDIEQFGFDDLTIHRLKKLEKERKNLQD